MADIVNLQQSEYDTAIETLNSLHTTAMTGITKIANEISSLSEVEGGFYADQISAKIASLLETLNSSIVLPMSVNMEASKTSMDDFAQIILNVDTACSL